MSHFTLHTMETAPTESKPLFENSIKAFGMVPNLHAVMAESPEHLQGYQVLHDLFQKTSLSVTERNLVWLTINVEHGCHYCVPAHSAIALSQGVESDIVDTLRAGKPLADTRLEALRTFTLQMVRKRGDVSDAELDAFFAAGFTRRHALDVVLGLAQKVMSNYVNHIAKTPVDPPFAKFAWEPAAEVAAE